jgi:hypothetical protein
MTYKHKYNNLILYMIFFFIALFSIDAKPIFARYYKQSYGYMPSCSSCHKDGGGSVLNAYGEAFKKAGNSVGAFAKIPLRLHP